MSLYLTPLLYLNMGGEMLYVLRQRLKAQKISAEKTIQVLDDVIVALLDSRNLSIIFQKSYFVGMQTLRSMLETVVLCSIMKLDDDSMNKLFDLMTMLVKYQLTAATGPREVVLMTLNHTDSMRDMVTRSNAQESVGLVHQMIIDLYDYLTYDEIWKARNECLKVLEPYRVRVSVLLRLGLQNEDASFNLTRLNYDERYEDLRNSISNKKMNSEAMKNEGSFSLFGDRVTILGKNMYSPTYGSEEKLKPKRNNQNFLKDCGTKAELGMLAVQLGTEEISNRPFSLNFIGDDDGENYSNQKNNYVENNELEKSGTINNDDALSNDYKNTLDEAYTNFFETQQEDTRRNLSLLELLDETK